MPACPPKKVRQNKPCPIQTSSRNYRSSAKVTLESYDLVFSRKKSAMASFPTWPWAACKTSVSKTDSSATSVKPFSFKSSLVTIDKRMILNDMIKIGSAHLKQAGMKILVSKPGFGHSECGIQQSNIANTKTPPISVNLVGMDLNDIFD